MGFKNTAAATIGEGVRPPSSTGAGSFVPADGTARVWREVRARLRAEYGDIVYAAEIARLRVAETPDGRVRVICPNGFARAWAEDNLGARLRAIWAAFDPDPREILITAEGEATPAPASDRTAFAPAIPLGPHDGGASAAALAEPAASSPARAGEARGETRFTFDSFMVGKANMMAATAAKAIAAAEFPPFNPVFFHGDYGVGKTHLLSAIAHAAESGAVRRKALYLTAEEFLNGFRAALRARDMQPFKDQVRKCDLLLIDDVHFIAGKPRTEDEFAHTVTSLLSENRQVVLASHCAPKDLDVADARLASILRGGFACPMEGPDLDLRRKIIDCKIEQAARHLPGLEVGEAVRDFLAARVTSSARELEGVLNNVIVRTAFMGAEVTVATVEEALAELPMKAERKLTVDDIQKATAAYFGLSVDDLLSPRRSQSIVRPRHIAMYLAKTLTTRSLPDIGRRFGGRDHSTVIHAVNKISERLAGDPVLAEDVEAVKRRLRG